MTLGKDRWGPALLKSSGFFDLQNDSMEKNNIEKALMDFKNRFKELANIKKRG